jgi:phenylpropionate dioxygenase-like ring-hydroxylating dioxygenase large terminal subunit
MDAPRSLTKGDGHVSVARVTEAWYVACTSDELGDGPLARTLLGIPLVLFRGRGGEPGALLDRCAHRNVPLSNGRVQDCRLECPYHGWQFETDGHCSHVPSLCGDPGFKKSLVPRFATREQEGFVWVYASADAEPTGEPFRLPELATDARYTTVRRTVEAQGTLHATVENALDVPHTAYVHRGLFRGTGTRNRVKAIVTRGSDRVVTEYVGEPRPEGIVGRMLSPSGGIVTHFDRFIMPSIAQVEYGIGSENHILVSAICTPVEDFVTRLYAVVSFRTRLPAWLLQQAVLPVALKIFAQDKRILKTQTDAIQHFGGEHYTSTEIDIMGPQIWRLLRRAELGKSDDESDGDAQWRREIELEV